MERAAGEIIRSKTQPRNIRGGEITPSRYRGKFKVNDTLLFFKSYRRIACDRESRSSERTSIRPGIRIYVYTSFFLFLDDRSIRC